MFLTRARYGTSFVQARRIATPYRLLGTWTNFLMARGCCDTSFTLQVPVSSSWDLDKFFETAQLVSLLSVMV